jgi:iron(III) transport system substrate-binding protein
MRVAFTLIFALALGACTGTDRQVVVYTSHDQILSEPILDLFAERTGIEVLPVYDTEATKTTGLVQRLIAEADRPRCDVFWNNEIVQTLRLVERGVTQPHRSPCAEGIPDAFRDPAGHWTGFAARARVIVFNTRMWSFSVTPRRYEDALTGPQSGMALPLFGTTATHFAFIHSRDGAEAAEAWLRELRANGTQILDSNGQVCDAVARGALEMGWTDTDDAAVAIAEEYPVNQLIPTEGAILIPNTVVMIAGAPHPEEARELIDFLLSPEVEERLAAGPGKQIPLHAGVAVPEGVLRIDEIPIQEIDWPAVAQSFDAATDLVGEMLVDGD